jgi:peptidase inhibitor I78 family protein
MRRIALTIVPLLAASLGACAAKPPMRTGGALPPTLQTCDAQAARAAIGAVATTARVEEIRQQARARSVRVVRPGQLVTMEFNGERADIRVDANNVVLGVSCG